MVGDYMIPWLTDQILATVLTIIMCVLVGKTIFYEKCKIKSWFLKFLFTTLMGAFFLLGAMVFWAVVLFVCLKLGGQT